MYNFESVFDKDELDLDMGVMVLDPEGIHPPHTILQDEDDWKVRVKWQLKGTGADMIAGTWLLSIFVESIGHGPEKPLVYEKAIPLHESLDYAEMVDVKANQLPVGIYKLVVLLGHKNAFGKRTETAAFYEGPVIQIYKHE